MQWLARVCVDRPVFTWVLSLCLMVVGVASLGGLPVDRFPNIDIPVVAVISTYQGASPEQVETEVTDILEEAINSVAGVSELRSTSYEGLSVITVQFDLDKDVDVAAQEVRDRVDRVAGSLPSSMDPPRVQKTDPDAAPLLYVALRGPGTPQELSTFAKDEVKARLESKSGVGSISLLGARERELRVEVDPARLDAQGLSVLDLRTALTRGNVELPGGGVNQGARTLQVRVPARVKSADELASLAVAERDGHVVRLADVATVSDGAAEAEALASLDGDPVVLLSITRQSGTNAIAVADGLRAELDALRGSMPAGYSLEVVRDESVFPRTAVHAVEEHLVLGALFAVLVVLSFLRNGRSTVIAALAIPVSIVGTFAVLNALGLTLNMITLLALTLAVGIVIDDAIVVLENVIRFMEERNLSPREATLEGTKQIGLAVLATTLSLVAVFLPVAFMGGIVGRFLASFGITMSVAVLVSLFVAFTLTPMLTARWLKPSPAHAKRPQPAEQAKPMTSAEERARYAAWRTGRVEIATQDGWLERSYGKLLAFAMERRWLVGLVMLASLGSMALVGPHLSTGFLPTDDEARFEVSLEAAQGTSLAQMELLSERVARDIRVLPGVEHTVVQVGSGSDDATGRGSNEALVYVALVPDAQRTLSQTDLMQKVRTEIMPRHQRQLEASISTISAMGGSGAQAAPIQYLVRGPDLKKLAEYSHTLADAVRKQPGVYEADTTLKEGRPELHVELDRVRAARLGVSAADVADTLRVLVGGLDVTELSIDGEQYQVNLRASAEHRGGEADLDRYRVQAQDGSLVPLSQLAKTQASTGPSAIEHIGRERSVMVYANTLPGASTQALLKSLDETSRSLDMPGAYSTALTGQAKEFGKAANAFLLSVVLSFVFMYLVIAAQFESWIHPLTILASLPLTLPFALLSLLIFGQSLNVFSALGILVLFGIVKKNSILQVDHMLTLEREGFSRPDAIMLANRDRLRPILMTTIAFVAGMVPLMISGGAGSGTNHAIAGIVLGGQSLALLLTLVATPVLYSWLGDLTRASRGLFARLRTRRSAALAAGAVVLGLVATWTPTQALALQPLDQFVAGAKAKNPDNLEAQATEQQREAQTDAARAAYLPSLSAQGVYTRNQYGAEFPQEDGSKLVILPQDQLDAYFTANVPLIDVSAWLQKRAAKANADAAGAARANTELSVETSVTQAYYELLGWEAVLSAAQQSVEAASKNVDLVQARKAAGTASELDLQRAIADLARVEQELAASDQRVVNARRALESLTRVRPEAATPDDYIEDELSEEQPLEHWLGTSSDDLVAVKSARASTKAAERSHQASKAAWLPTLSAQGQERLTNATGFTGRSSVYTVTGTLSWKLDFGVAPKAAAQAAAVEAARAREDKARRAAEDTIYRAWHQVRAGIAKARAARAQLKAASLSQQLAGDRYANGVATQLEVVEARRDLFTAAVARVQADTDLRYARALLRLSSQRTE